jgi:hypothetical protein
MFPLICVTCCSLCPDIQLHFQVCLFLSDNQGRSVHINCVSRVSPANTLKNENKKSSVLLSWFSGTYTLEHRRTDQIKYVVSQPGARRERKPQLAG